MAEYRDGVQSPASLLAPSSGAKRVDYFGPYATSHDAIDGDTALQEEVRNAARALIAQVTVRRNGQVAPDQQLEDPRPK